jgi:hypothetical protein
MKAYLLIAAAVVIQPAASLAQTSPAGAGFQQAQSLGAGVGVGMLWPTAMGGRWMAGKPYSATAITHTVQLLADGSQIERTQSEALYRDDQGRTRSELFLPKGLLGLALRDSRARPEGKTETSPIALEEGADS